MNKKQKLFKAILSAIFIFAVILGAYQFLKNPEKIIANEGDPINSFGTGGNGVINYNPTIFQDGATGIAIDSNYLYVVGNVSDVPAAPTDSKWEIKKIDLITGNILLSQPVNPTSVYDTVYDIATDSSGIYLVGTAFNRSRWEMRKFDFNLNPGWAQNSIASFNQNVAHGVATDGSAIYVVGSISSSGFGTPQWRIEKRNSSAPGDMVNSFNGNGIVVVNTEPLYSTAYDVAVYGNYIYIVGEEYVTPSQSQWRIEKRDKNTGSSVIPGWIKNTSFGNPYNSASGVAVDSTGIYIVGIEQNYSSQERAVIEKRDFNGNLDGSFNGTGIKTYSWNTNLSKIIAYNSNIYVVGKEEISPGNYQWWIEKIDGNTGSQIWKKNTAISHASIVHNANDMAVDSAGVYVVGDEEVSSLNNQWRIEKRDNQPSAASSNKNYAWSYNIGWISFTCQNTGSCASLPYVVQRDINTGSLSGYAWSSNIGLISFQPADVSGCPSGGTCGAVAPVGGGLVTGWARALSASVVSDWDGWISLNCQNTGSCGGLNYGVQFNNSTGDLSGYAWGGDVVGWISFKDSINSIPNYVVNFPGTPPPTSPTNLSVTAASCSQIDLFWADNSNNETGFKIESKIGMAGSWSEIATVGADITNYSNTGLNASTQYYYRVRAYNTGGDSAYTNEPSATTPACACVSLTFISGSVSPGVVNTGGNYTLECDYGQAGIDSIDPMIGSGSCLFSGFSGTVANFNCIAGATAGTFSNSCGLKAGTSSNNCVRTDSINNLNVTAICPNDCTAWSNWSSCSVSCGGGVETRSCTSVQCNGYTQSQSCNMNLCTSLNATLSANPSSGTAPFKTTISVSSITNGTPPYKVNSYDYDCGGGTSNFLLSGNGEFSSVPTQIMECSYSSSGTYTVKVKIKDSVGNETNPDASLQVIVKKRVIIEM